MGGIPFTGVTYDADAMRRVLLIGSPGAGKSTLATQLGQRLGLPVVHLDALFWQTGWKETPRDVWSRRVAELVQGERWIIDGNYGGTLEARVGPADTIVLLAFPRLQCVWRVLRRAARDRGQPRADLHPECPEQWPDWTFLKWIWSFPHSELPEVHEILGRYARHKRIVVLRSSQEVHSFLRSLGDGNR